MVRQTRWGRRSQKGGGECRHGNMVTSDYPTLFIEHIFVLRPPAVSSLHAALLLLIKASRLGWKKTISRQGGGVGSKEWLSVLFLGRL